MEEPNFWKNANLVAEGCWIWQRSLFKNGYGQVRFAGKKRTTHRVAWTLINGPIPHGLSVLHSCDDRACIRPEHLWLGTQADNMRDMSAKGRQSIQAHPERRCIGMDHWTHAKPELIKRGESCANAKLQRVDIPVIKSLHASGSTMISIAHKFNVSDECIRSVIRGINWKHVK